MSRQSNVYTLHKGPAIELIIHAEEEKILSVDAHSSTTSGLKWQIQQSSENEEVKDLVDRWLLDYSNKKNSQVILPLKWQPFSPFTLEVLTTLQTLPFAQVKSYGQIAEMLYRPNAYRAVGTACGKNPFLLFVPCHRVIGFNNRLGGFGAGLDIKKRLLDFECKDLIIR